MDNLAIKLKNVSIRIPIYSNETRTLKKTLLRSLTGGKLYRSNNKTYIDALRDINCSIYRGDRVALIGHNGSGKTTFLRTVAGIYTPTKGSLTTHCSVHPMIQKTFITGAELSGYQAVKGHYLLMNNTLRGFDDFLQEIIDFSELGDFIRLPMKGYSEGMSARLLFALLTSGKHECLALDEGFGTGDSRFFKKAQLRLAKFIENAGTLFLASHSEALLRQFCTRGLVFEHGKIIFDGDLDLALSFYNEQNN